MQYGTDFRTKMNEIWNQVFQQHLPGMTNAESATVNSRYNSEAMNLANQLASIQQQRGSLSYQDVAQFLNTFITQIVTSMRQSNSGYFGNNGMMGTPAIGINPMGGMPTYGMNQNYNYGINRPMSGFGMGTGYGYGQPQAFRPMPSNNGLMPSQQISEMANMYDMKPSKPQVAVPPTTYQQTVQPNAMMSATIPPTSTTPSPKINVEIEAYTEPLKEKSTSFDAKRYGLTGVTHAEYIDQHNKKLNVVTASVTKWVTTIHTKLAELIDIYKPNFIQLKYHTFRVVTIPYADLSKTMFEIKDVIQKAKAAEQEYDPFERLEMILHVLDDKTRGCSNFVESLIVDKFNKFAYATNLTVGVIESASKILSFKSSVKDMTIMKSLDSIISDIIDNELSNTLIMDCTSNEVTEYINDIECDGDRLVKEVKDADTARFAKWTKSHSFVVSALRVTNWTNLVFNDTVTQLDDNRFTILSQSVSMDDSPIDTDLEYFIKTIGRNDLISNLLINVNNTVSNYFVVATNAAISLRPAGIF